MHTISRRVTRGALAALAAVVAATGCGAPSEPGAVEARVGALRFAGVDLIYALRRVAGDAGLLLVLDEIRARELSGEDLRLERVDVDLPAGSVHDALAELQKLTKFDYTIDDDMLLVRSARSLDVPTALDAPDLPAVRLETDFPGLIRWLSQTQPAAYVHPGARRGQPVFRKVTLDVEAGSSVLELLVDFARAAGTGMRIRRAGYSVEGEDERVVATTVGMWRALESPVAVPFERSSRGIVSGLASIEDRTGVSICVVDRSVLFDGRGSLSFATKIDRGLELEAALDAIAWRGNDVDPDFTWERRDGLVRVRSRSFSYYLTGRDLLDETLRAGTFEGSLAELGRWLNGHRREPSDKVLVGGEVIDSAPRARIEIADGTRLEDVLYQFAAASGEGWSFVVRDSASPRQPLEGTWAGAHLSRLADWGPRGKRPRD